jgi:hypothetical protein
MTRTFQNLIAGIMLSAVTLSGGAHAFSVGNLFSNQSDSEEAPKVDLVAAEEDVVRMISSSLLNLTLAQVIIFEAIGLKEEAAIAEEYANSMEEGSLMGKKEMEANISKSQELNEKIVEKLEEKQDLDEDAKVMFATSLPPYAKGAMSGIQGSQRAIEIAQSIQSNPLNVLKFGTVIFVAKEAPGLISSFTATTGALQDFATYQGIPTEDLEEVAGL